MTINDYSEVLSQSFADLWSGVIGFLPELIVAAIIFIVGWLIGALFGRAVAQIVRSLKVDNALKGAGFEGAINRAGYKLDIGKFIGGLVKWFIIVVFLVAALDVLGLSQVNVFLQQVVLLFLPQVFVAVLILLVSVVIAEAVQHAVVGAARAAHMSSANFLGAVSRWAIWVFAILAALFQLGVAAAFVQTLFTGIVLAISLAVGLSFGLGGQEAAARYIERMKKEVSRE
ncbi:hypothetical protein COV42_01155 [Candidatus Campbellbacteria bacterium CG11_big_fil_rev_8_21_14_0_20_44_21]|uniref:Small-conductance mechanosensitive ion channel n=1 Tax=Candidatus Campbellbacteria bacterium CG22_combo_CG10-13_8_21_14_all_43_18 TaxID=1974530 RepID=A0A2H0DWF3_9BACT|nr:MAG: hypothetical protein COW82_01475 [Candidatus Campbellbacteria bacterium CG22_combo_CG10-13_8_21_14_all_43_18]PIR24328.1 MAG: hypothetical protein COV42_01155 [Candidatus Campbellbacteria bacterium CG11_big_fil_rev_8_21_14_0_20_44_21]